MKSQKLNDLSRSVIRRNKLISYLSICDSESKQIDLLIDMVLSLQNQLEELQMCYMELKRYNRQCVQNRF